MNTLNCLPNFVSMPVYTQHAKRNKETNFEPNLNTISQGSVLSYNDIVKHSISELSFGSKLRLD